MTAVERWIERVRTISPSKLTSNEAQTRRVLIDPLLRLVGWDIENENEVLSEYQLYGDRADYVMANAEGPVLLVEAKPFESNLSDIKNVVQAVNYGNTLNVPFSVLTDGKGIAIYAVHAPVQMSDKLFKYVNIAHDTAAKVAELLDLISKDSVLSGRLSAAWSLEWKRRVLERDFHVRHTGIVDEAFRRAVLGAEIAMGSRLMNESSANSFTSDDGMAVQFSMSSPYKCAEDTWFLKIDPRHLEGDVFVLWTANSRNCWAFPTSELLAFLSAIPLSGRKQGAKTWDPRVRIRNGKEVLWTHRSKYGELDVSKWRFQCSPDRSHPTSLESHRR
jgi:hypothetical protein